MTKEDRWDDDDGGGGGDDDDDGGEGGDGGGGVGDHEDADLVGGEADHDGEGNTREEDTLIEEVKGI